MGTLVALGGGEIGGRGTAPETTTIDKEIIKLTGKKHPKLLFLPTASEDDAEYCKDVEKHFGKRLGCAVSHLLLTKNSSPEEISKAIFSADIIYVGGGRTNFLLRTWKKYGVDVLLREVYEKNTAILVGLSAGANCWFRYFNSFIQSSGNFFRLSGLDFFPALFCPHYDIEERRKTTLKEMMKRTNVVGIAAENNCALLIKNNKYKILKSNTNSKAYKLFWSGERYCIQKIPFQKDYQPLTKLFSKNVATF